MPKLKQTSTEKQNARIIAIISYYKSYNGYSYKELALAAKTSRDTWFRRLRKPQDFKVSELDGLAKKFHIPITAFFEAGDIV